MPDNILLLLILSLVFRQSQCLIDFRTQILNSWENQNLTGGREVGKDWRWLPPNEKPIVVNVSIIIDNIFDVNATDMSFKLQFSFLQRWADSRLSYSTINESFVPMTLTAGYARRIWVPDTFFANSKHSWNHTNTRPNSYIKVYPNGTVLYNMRVTVKVHCKMNLQFFPMDIQKCSLQIESYGYQAQEIAIRWDLVTNVTLPEPSSDFTLTELRILEIKPVPMLRNLSTGRYEGCALEFTFTRDLMYFLVQSYIPAIIIVVLSWVSFWIIPDRGRATVAEVATSRAYIGVMMVLSMILVMNTSKTVLPNVDFLNAVDVYFFVSFVYVLAALTEFILVHFLNKQKRKWMQRHHTLQLVERSIVYPDSSSDDSCDFMQNPAAAASRLVSPRLSLGTGDLYAETRLGGGGGGRLQVRSSYRCRHPINNWRDNVSPCQRTVPHSHPAATVSDGEAAAGFVCQRGADNEIMYLPSSNTEHSSSEEPEVWNRHNLLPSANFIHNKFFREDGAASDTTMPYHYPLANGSATFLPLPTPRGRYRRRRRLTDRHRCLNWFMRRVDVGQIDYYSRIWFPLSFLVLNFFYWVTYMHLGKTEHD